MSRTGSTCGQVVVSTSVCEDKCLQEALLKASGRPVNRQRRASQHAAEGRGG